MTTSRESGSFGSSFNLEETTGFAALLQNETAQLNITEVVAQWSLAMEVVLGVLAPPGFMSTFLPSVTANNLSSIRIAYFGEQRRREGLMSRRCWRTSEYSCQ